MKRLCILILCLHYFSATAFCNITNSRENQKRKIEQQIRINSGSRKIELLLILAILNNDSLQKAMELNQVALKDAKKLDDRYWIARTYTTRAMIRLLDGSSNDSVAADLAKAEKSFKIGGYNKFHPEFYYCKARYYFRLNDLKSANALCQDALLSINDQSQQRLQADIYLLLARIKKQQGNSSEFVENLIQAEKYYRQCNDKWAAGRSLISIGLLYHDAGMNEIAQKIMVRATHLCEQTSDSLYMAYLYCNTSGVYKSGPNNDQQYQMLMRAVAIFTKLQNDKGLGYAENMLGLYSLGLNKFENADTWFRKTIHTKTRCSDWQGACFAACNIADLNLTLKKYEPVVQALAEAKIYMKNSGDKLSEIVYYNTLGRFNLQDQNYSEAVANLNRSLILARQTLDANFYLSNLKILSDLYQAMGDESKALDYYRKYSEAGDSVHNANSSFVQQEIKNELNADELIDKAVNEREIHQPNYRGTILSVTVIAGIIFLISLSVSAFNKTKGTPPLLKADTDKEQPTATQAGKEIVLKLDEHIQQSIWERIQSAMTEHKYYLRQDLTLHELASLLGTNTLYISRIINARTGHNFNSFINQYRIEEACKILVADQQQLMSIEGIALTCGFKSKSAFNAAFKKLKGVTPTEYIEKQKLAI